MGAEAVTKFSAGMVRRDGVPSTDEVTAMLRLKKLWAETHRVNRKLPVQQGCKPFWRSCRQHPICTACAYVLTLWRVCLELGKFRGADAHSCRGKINTMRRIDLVAGFSLQVCRAKECGGFAFPRMG
jgi:hypothetical protein